MEATNTKPRERAKKRKPVSKRTQLKRRQEFDIRALSKGELDETMKDVNVQWTRYYQGVLPGGADEAIALQRALTCGTTNFLFTVYPGLGFPPLASAIKRLLSVQAELDGVFTTYSIPLADLTPEFKEFLEREARLGRCILKRTSCIVRAIQLLDVQRGSTVLDILADEESHELCQRSEELVLLQRKMPPCFDATSAVWQSSASTGGGAEALVQYDRILCRVPNTEDGQMQTRKAWTNWKTSNAKDLALLQCKITLELLSKHLSVGGKLVYVTNSVNPVENDLVMENLLRLCPNGEIRITERVHIPVREPGGGGFCCLIEKLGPVEYRPAVQFSDAAELMRANDCLAALKVPSCLGTMVGVSRHRPTRVAEGPFLVELDESLRRDLKLENAQILTACALPNSNSAGGGRESYLCTQAVADYYFAAMSGGEAAVVRRCGLLLLLEPDAPLEQRALIHVQAGLKTIPVLGEQLAGQVLRQALKSKLVAMTGELALQQQQQDEEDAGTDENYYLLRLSFSDHDPKRDKQALVASGALSGERISTAQRKRMKKDAAAAAVASTNNKGASTPRSCLLFGRIIFDEEDNKLLEISNDEDWLESCAHALFASL